MSRPIKYLIIICSVVFLLILAPGLVPLNKYKNLISTKVQEATGRELTIDGNISLSILPRPKVKIKDIKLAALPEASYPHLVELKAVEAALAISPLLLGKIVISYIEFDSPKVTLEKLANGKETWVFEKIDVASIPAKNNSNESSNTGDLPFNIKRLIIGNGEVQYINANNRTAVGDLDLNVNIENLKGPIDFDLAFKILNQDVNLNGRLKEIGNIIPFDVELKTQGENVKLQGVANVDNSSFEGDINAYGNLKNIKLVESSSLPAGLKEEHKFSAKIEANKSEIKINAIDFKMGEISAKGQGNYTLDKAAGSLNLVLNPGNMAINIIPSKMVDDGLITSKIQFKASSVKPILEALKIDLKSFPDFLSQNFMLVTDLKYKDQELNFQNIDFNLGNANLQGYVGVKNWSSDLTIPYDLKTKNANALLNLTGNATTMNMGDMQVKGKTSKKDHVINTDTTITLAKSDINIKGDVNIKKDIEPDLKVNISGDGLNQTIAQLSKKQPIKNLGSYNILAKINGNIKKEIAINIENFSIFLAREKTNLSGKANLKLDGEKPKVTLDLMISAINLDLLSDGSTSSPTVANGVANGSAVSSGRKNHWSNEKIDLSFIEGFNADCNLSMAKITSGSLAFDNLKARLNLNNGVLELNPLTGNLYSGNVEANAKVVSHKGGNSDISFKASLNNAQLRNIVSTQGKFKVTNGKIDFNADIKTKGNSQSSWVNNLQGEVNLNGKDGTLSGFDLNKIVSALNNVRNLQNILKVLDNSFLNGETVFKTLENKLVIENGIAKLATSKIIAKGGEANATGIIDLPKYSLNINAEVKVEVKNMPPFKSHLYGQIDNPQYNLDTKALQQYLIDNVLTSVLDNIKSGKTKPADILKGIIGGNKNNKEQQNNSSENEQAKPQNSTEKNEVNKLINKGLKNLFK